MDGDSLKLNFEIALERIGTLSEQNQSLMDRVQDLEYKLSESNNEIKLEPTTPESRLHDTNAEAEAAMKRYKQFLRKEFPNAKSKQSKRQSV